MKPLKRHAVIHIRNDTGAEAEIVFVPGSKPYIHVYVVDAEDFHVLSGFIEDKDIEKFKRMAASL